MYRSIRQKTALSSSYAKVRARMDSRKNEPMLSFTLPRAGHARLACEVNLDVRDQQQEPTEVSQLKRWTQQEAPRFSKGRMSS